MQFIIINNKKELKKLQKNNFIFVPGRKDFIPFPLYYKLEDNQYTIISEEIFNAKTKNK